MSSSLIPLRPEEGHVQVESVEIDGDTCIAAADFISSACKSTRHEAQQTIMNLLNSKNSGEEANEILCRKAVVPGFQQPTWVINYDECLELVYLLPKKHVKDLLAFIRKKIKRVRAGDQSLHEEVDARAADNRLEARMARESLRVWGCRLSCWTLALRSVPSEAQVSPT